MSATETTHVISEVPQDVRDAQDVLQGVKSGNLTPEEIARAQADIQTLYDEAPLVYKEAKAGYKTTEFWTSVVVSFLDVATQIPFHDKMVVSAVALAYAVARGLAKNGKPHTEPDV